MAYREIGMWEILEVLRRVARGERRRAIERVTGHSRNTIRRWLQRGTQARLGAGPGRARRGACQPPWRSGSVPCGTRCRRVRARPGSCPTGNRSRPGLRPRTTHRGLRLTKVQQLLTRRGVDVPYSSLHRFAVQHCGFADRRRLTVRRAETAPGELAEVDFGRLGLVWDPEAERQTRLPRADRHARP